MSEDTCKSSRIIFFMQKQRLPGWLKKKTDLRNTRSLKTMFRALRLHTVCESAHCPNISECFASGHATFMILGDICTRSCGFCAVKKGTPCDVLASEPQSVAMAVKKLGLKYVVITSVSRDDIEDYGASGFARTISAVRSVSSSKIEVLTPDFRGDRCAIETVVQACPDVFNHNMETVPRLYSAVRPQASYVNSLGLLRMVKEIKSSIYTKSGLMLGLGEKEEEVEEVMRSLRSVGCDILTLGQYLKPSRDHYPVRDYISPQKFDSYRQMAESMGFAFVASAPYVRSSYRAYEGFKQLVAKS
ncbi:MAG: lipoyl synthase [bacterium]